MKAYMGNSNLFRGYLPMDEPGNQKAYRGKAIEGFQPHLDPARMKARKPHKNEAFQASLELPDDDLDVAAGKPLHGANLWPDNLPGFREAVLDYHTTMTEFAALLASVFARGLKLPPDYFAQFYKKPLIQVRLLHYLSQDQQAALEGGDSRAHQDAGGFTMLQQDDVGGLEIKTKSGEWLIVPPVENSFVVNIGDSMRHVDQQPLRLDPAPRGQPLRPRALFGGHLRQSRLRHGDPAAADLRRFRASADLRQDAVGRGAAVPLQPRVAVAGPAGQGVGRIRSHSPPHRGYRDGEVSA